MKYQMPYEQIKRWRRFDDWRKIIRVMRWIVSYEQSSDIINRFHELADTLSHNSMLARSSNSQWAIYWVGDTLGGFLPAKHKQERAHSSRFYTYDPETIIKVLPEIATLISHVWSHATYLVPGVGRPSLTWLCAQILMTSVIGGSGMIQTKKAFFSFSLAQVLEQSSDSHSPIFNSLKLIGKI